jgi:hypothetical protein
MNSIICIRKKTPTLVIRCLHLSRRIGDIPSMDGPLMYTNIQDPSVFCSNGIFIWPGENGFRKDGMGRGVGEKEIKNLPREGSNLQPLD